MTRNQGKSPNGGAQNRSGAPVTSSLQNQHLLFLMDTKKMGLVGLYYSSKEELPDFCISSST